LAGSPAGGAVFPLRQADLRRRRAILPRRRLICREKRLVEAATGRRLLRRAVEEDDASFPEKTSRLSRRRAVVWINVPSLRRMLRRTLDAPSKSRTPRLPRKRPVEVDDVPCRIPTVRFCGRCAVGRQNVPSIDRRGVVLRSWPVPRNDTPIQETTGRRGGDSRRQKEGRAGARPRTGNSGQRSG
jgi:hypothetical protein